MSVQSKPGGQENGLSTMVFFRASQKLKLNLLVQSLHCLCRFPSFKDPSITATESPNNCSLQGPDVDYVAVVYELFESPKHEKYFHARWFWRVEDTVSLK
jgi:hypothetical protein